MVRSNQLYSCTNQLINVQISPFVYKIGHMRGHFGVVFQAKSNGEVNSAVQLYKSADKCADFSICVQNWAYEASFWGSFLSQIQL